MNSIAAGIRALIRSVWGINHRIAILEAHMGIKPELVKQESIEDLQIQIEEDNLVRSTTRRAEKLHAVIDKKHRSKLINFYLFFVVDSPKVLSFFQEEAMNACNQTVPPHMQVLLRGSCVLDIIAIAMRSMNAQEARLLPSDYQLLVDFLSQSLYASCHEYVGP